MKKILSIILTLLMLFSLFSCVFPSGENSGSEKDDEKVNSGNEDKPEEEDKTPEDDDKGEVESPGSPDSPDNNDPENTDPEGGDGESEGGSETEGGETDEELELPPIKV